jgi:hypothetical protein
VANEWGERSITSLFCNGPPQKCSDANWIFWHGGGGLTACAERLLVQMVTTPPHEGGFAPCVWSDMAGPSAVAVR